MEGLMDLAINSHGGEPQETESDLFLKQGLSSWSHADFIFMTFFLPTTLED